MEDNIKNEVTLMKEAQEYNLMDNPELDPPDVAPIEEGEDSVNT